MKNISPSARILRFARSTILVLLLFTTYSYAQQATDTRIKMTWDTQVGCQINEIDENDFKDINELIENGICPRVCENTVVVYTLSSENQNWTSSNWAATGGTIITQTLTSCKIQWGAAGTGNVSVQINTKEMGIQFREICVEIIKGPKAKFGIYPEFGDKATVCAGEEVFFTNRSSAEGGSELISYYWNFKDGTFSSAFEPSHIFADTGEYDVELTVTNSCNCKNTYTMRVVVGSRGVKISCPGVVCEGQTQSYSVPRGTRSICSQFLWSVEGGSFVGNSNGQAVQVLWNNVGESGFGYLTFDASTCALPCATKTTVKIPVVTSEGTIKGETNACAGEQYLYRLPEWPDTDFTWTFQENTSGATLVRTDQRNEILVNAGTGGQIILRATYKNMLLGCNGSGFIKINVKKKPEINGNTQTCVGNSESYSIGDNSAVWKLSGPTGEQTANGSDVNFAFSMAGTYTLSVTSEIFCNSKSITITVHESLPAPALTQFTGPQEICVSSPFTYSLEPLVGYETYWETSSNGLIIGSSVGSEITAIFSNSSIPAKLRVYRKSNTFPYCPSEPTQITLAFPAVNGDITGDAIVCPESLRPYSIGYSGGEDYTWSVSPSNLGSVVFNGAANASIQWNATTVAQNAIVKVRIRKCNLYFEKEFAVTIKGTPNAHVTGATTVCSLDDLELEVALPASTVWESITWNFGDNNSVTIPYPNTTVTHAYNSTSGSNLQFTVNATINAPNGCNAFTVIHPVTVSPLPVANITPSGSKSFCIDDPIYLQLTATIQAVNGINNPNAIAWYRNGIFLQNGYTLTATAVGDYYAIVTNTNNCSAETNHVSINQAPCIASCESIHSIDLNASISGCATIGATATTDSPPLSYQWDTNGNATIITSTQNSFEASYPKAGVYTVSYEARYPGCDIFSQKSVLVPYVSSLKYRITCGSIENENTYKIKLIDDSSFMPGTPITNRIFKVGNTVVYNGSNSEFEVSLSPGEHTISVTVSAPNPLGGIFPACTSSIIISLPDLPTADFEFDDNMCLGEALIFTAQDNIAGLSYLWDFGDGSQSRLREVKKVFATSGIKTVTLTITNRYGCTFVSEPKSVTVKANNLNGRIVTPARACKGSTINLSYVNQGLSIPNRYIWMSGTTQVAETTVPTFGVSTTGSYWVITEDAFGCKNKNMASVPVAFMTPPSSTITGPASVCINSIFELRVADTPGAMYEWRLNGVIIGNQSSIIYETSYSGNLNFSVTVTRTQTKVTCSSTSQHTVTVFDTPEEPRIFPYFLDNCETYEFKLVAEGPGEGTYNWSNGDTGQEIYVFEGGVYKVIFTNLAGCTSEAVVNVPKKSDRYMWIFPSGCYTLCDSSEPEFLGPLDTAHFQSWQWMHDDNVIVEGNNIVPSYPILVQNGNGDYQLNLHNSICFTKSQPASINFIKCNCDLKFEVKTESKSSPFCHYALDINFDNTFGAPITVSLSVPSGMGVFQPSTYTLAPGVNQFSGIFIPSDNFAGDTSLVLAFTTTLPNGDKCRGERLVKFYELCPESAKTASQKTAQSDFETLAVVPNPALSDAALHYHFVGKSTESRTISIYTLIGILVDEYQPKTADGVWNVSLDKYPSGQYIAVMRENGTMVAQKNLIKK